jgi:hypothetical protein
VHRRGDFENIVARGGRFNMRVPAFGSIAHSS